MTDPRRTYYLFESWPFRLEVTDQAVNVKVRFRGSVSIPLEGIVDVHRRHGSITIATTQGVYPRWGLSTPDRAEAAVRAIAEAQADKAHSDAKASAWQTRPSGKEDSGEGTEDRSASRAGQWNAANAEGDARPFEPGGASRATRGHGESPQHAAIEAHIAAVERDMSQAVRAGFRAGATASEAMQTVLAATEAEPGDDAWRRSIRDRLRMHGLDEIAQVLQEDPAKAKDFANSLREEAGQGVPAAHQAQQGDDPTELVKAWLSTLSPAERAEFDTVMRQEAGNQRAKQHAAALAAHECRAHPECGPVTALGQSGHGHHSPVTSLWCWHFSERWIGPLDPPPPEGSDAAMRRAQGCIDGDPSIHKTYPTAGPREGYWSEEFASAAGLTRRGVATTPES
jgi:hypothetical protein